MENEKISKLATTMKIQLPARLPGGGAGGAGTAARPGTGYSDHARPMSDTRATVVSSTPAVMAPPAPVAVKRDLTQHYLAMVYGNMNFREFFQSILDGVVITDPDGVIVDANSQALAMLQAERTRFIGTNILAVIGRADESLLTAIRQNLDAQSLVQIQAYCVRHDQSFFSAEISVNRLVLSGQKYLSFFLRDTTSQKQVEDALHDERQRLSALLNYLPDCIFVKDTQGRFLMANITMARLMGLEQPEQLVGRTDADFYPTEIAVQNLAFDQQIMSTFQPMLNREELWSDSTGSRRLLAISKIPVKDPYEQVSGLVVIGHDITIRRVLEQQLASAQKLESIDQLMTGIALEINSPIQYVNDNVRFLQEAFQSLMPALQKYAALTVAAESGTVPMPLLTEVKSAATTAGVDYIRAEIPNALNRSKEGLERVSRIVQNMKEMTQPDASGKILTDLNSCVLSTVNASYGEWKRVAEMALDLDSELPKVPCYPGELNQVLLNLIVNAVHAIADVVGDGSKGKGHISIKTCREASGVGICVRDTGSGIPEAVQPRIFEPFFTTKGADKGTGLGLSICHGIVTNKHGGQISFETEPGRGTTFIIHLPVPQSLPTTQLPAPPPTQATM